MEENNLIDREALGQFVDALIARKNGGQPILMPPEEREKLMVKADEAIGQAVIGSLTPDKLAELNDKLEEKSINSGEQVTEFLTQNGVNIDEEVEKALQSFTEDYLGGQNGQ